MKLLIIEDEKELSGNIAAYMSSENYVCEQAFSYDEALTKVCLYDYDCVLLDLMLPGGNGLDILRAIREKKNPVGSSSCRPKTRWTTRSKDLKSAPTTIWPSLSICRN